MRADGVGRGEVYARNEGGSRWHARAGGVLTRARTRVARGDDAQGRKQEEESAQGGRLFGVRKTGRPKRESENGRDFSNWEGNSKSSQKCENF